MREVIYERIPCDFDRYIEVFGDAGWVLFGMPDHIRKRYCMEVYNDYNSNLTNLFACIRDKPLSFIKELGFLPLHSREEFKILRDFIKQEIFLQDYATEKELAVLLLEPPQSDEIIEILQERAERYDVQRAVSFFKLIRYSYAGSTTSYSCKPFNVRNTFGMIWDASIRLSATCIENKDFEALIRQYDRPDAFFYCDPPYFETEDYYDVDFSIEDHQRLRNLLGTIQGRFLLSYNDCAYIRELYKDFHIESVERTNNMLQRYEGGSTFQEVLISNYDTSQRRGTGGEQISLFTAAYAAERNQENETTDNGNDE